MYRDVLLNKWFLASFIFFVIFSIGCFLYYRNTVAEVQQRMAANQALLDQLAAEEKKAAEKLSAPTDYEDMMGQDTISGAHASVNSGDHASSQKEKLLPKNGSQMESGDKSDVKDPSSAVSETTDDPTVVSPFGLGPYPKIPESWPKGYQYWPSPTKLHELLQRVGIKLTEQGIDFIGGTASGSTGLVYPHIKGIVYVEWSERSDGGKYLSSIGGYPPDAQRVSEMVEEFDDHDIPYPYTEADFPNDIKLVNRDEAGIDPYEFLGLSR